MAEPGREKKKGVGNTQGQITIFFSLMLLLILAFTCSSLESARAAGMRLRLRLAADSSIQSAFAQYDRDLWENYGLLFRLDSEASGSGLMQAVSFYAEQNANPASDSLGTDWFAYRTEGVEIRSLVRAVDQNGQVFRQEVAAYMRSCGVAETAMEIWGRLNVIDESGELTEAGDLWQSQGGKEEADLSLLQQEYENLQEELASLAEGPSGENPEETGGEPEESTSPTEHEAVDPEIQKEAETTVGNWMGTIQRFAQDGFLTFVVEDVSAISDTVWDREDCPSSLSEEERGKNPGVVPAGSRIDQLLFHEYVIRHLDAYTTEESRGCEVEYVIAGKESDRENLAAVAGRLIWVREGFNLAYILTDTTKKAQVDGLAATLAGWTGMAPLVTGLSLLLLTVWSLGESVMDVRRLLQGEKVPLIKTAEDWRLRLDNVDAFVNWQMDTEEESPEDRGQGLSYEDYLRVLLLFSDPEEEAYRVMDVIQRNLQEFNPDFRMDCCVYGAEVTLAVGSDLLFPFLPGSEGYALNTRASYSYGDLWNP